VRTGIGIDIGGTFTDLVLRTGAGRVLIRKVPSSVPNYGRAILSGLAELLAEAALPAAALAEVRHGTTVASNAILERKVARTGLIATEGFRDILEIRNLRMPRLYDLTWEKPPPLIERCLRLTVPERIAVDGTVRTPLARAAAEPAVRALLAEGIEALAVSLINAFANPAHERLIQEIVAAMAPDLPCSISYDVLPEIKEYERTATTVVNACLLPVVARYIADLETGLAGAGVAAPLLLIQSNGGLTTAAAARRKPVTIIESGPAAGVAGAQRFGRASGLADLVTFDMGGTTAKASLIEDGEVLRAEEFQVGAGIVAGSRLLTGAGYLVRMPAIDIAEVGAGGGSVVWIDPGGALRVGPHSMGADPGPLCYARGGTEPTVTDAALLLGYINPHALAGGAVRLDPTAAMAGFTRRIGGPLGLAPEAAAYGTMQIAAATMIRAIRAVSVERGRDARTFVLFAFGGNGPVFAAAVAAELGMRRTVVPPAAGLFSSFGLLLTDLQHDYARTFRRVLAQAEPAEIETAWEELAAAGRAQLEEDGVPEARRRIVRTASLHYQGQTHELTVPVPPGPLDRPALAVLAEAFGAEHTRVYGHRAGPEEPVELVTIRASAHALPEDDIGWPAPPASATVHESVRRAYFGPDRGWLDTAIIGRAALTGGRAGPCIVEEYDATCVVPPGARAALGPFSSIVIDLP